MAYESTSVSVEKSRGQIAKVLTQWGAERIQWEDDITTGSAVLRFLWPSGPARLTARIRLSLPSPPATKKTRAQRDKWLEQERRRLHRVAFYWLKVQHEAIEAGLFQAHETMIPWLEDASGRTVAETLGANIRAIANADIGLRLALSGGGR